MRRLIIWKIDLTKEGATGSAIEFTINRRKHMLSREGVLDAMRGVAPEPLRTHVVDVGGSTYPVKQVFEVSTGIDRLDFTSAVARRKLSELGLKPRRI